ncbi:MAG: DNA recombination protein RmuC, partial [Gammaproteobacteria bacterium]|nr:DNA recombination protein RmuC [Gammaproteobacteria bacterium]
GSLERNVLPQARRFSELGVTADAPLAPPEPVGQLVRHSAGTPPETEPGAPTVKDVRKG